MSEETVTVETSEVPLADATMAEFKKARSEGKETATRETVKEATPEAEESKPKSKGGFQARIDRLIKQAAAAEERAKELEEKLNGKSKESETAPGKDGEPKREDFQSDIEYTKALTRWEVRQELKAEREESEKRAQEAKVKEARARYNERMIAIQSEDEEAKELMQQNISVPASIEYPITMEMENGPEVAIFLARNPDVCKELREMSPTKAIAEVWKISEKLEKGDEEPEEEEEKEEKPARRAPAPIRPISGGTSRSTIPLDKSDMATYKKLRAQGRVR